MLIETKDRRVLVETGIGDKFEPKRNSIYEVSHEKHDLLRSLGSLGFSREDVTDVILTHLHFDHAGGATMMEGGSAVPTFPGATHWIQRENLEHGRTPIEHDRASYLLENFEPLAKAGVLRTVEGERMLFPGITVSPIGGHAPGMQIVTVEGPQVSVVFCTDLVPPPRTSGSPGTWRMTSTCARPSSRRGFCLSAGRTAERSFSSTMIRSLPLSGSQEKGTSSSL